MQNTNNSKNKDGSGTKDAQPAAQSSGSIKAQGASGTPAQAN